MIVKTKLMLVGLACILKANPSIDVQKAEAGLSQKQVDFVAECTVFLKWDRNCRISSS
jgi:hypothetical protein